MRVLALLALFAVLLVCLLPQQIRSQEERNFWFLNNSSKAVMQLYVSPHEKGTWGGDVLGRATLPPGTGTLILFPANWRTSCSMDFKLVFDDESVQTYRQGRDVCSLHAVQFNQSTSEGF